MKMSNFNKLCLGLVLCVALLSATVLFSFVYVSKKSCDTKEHICGAEFLKQHNLNVLANYRGLFKLDLKSNDWRLECTDVRGSQRQEVDVVGGVAYFFDASHSGEYSIKKTCISDSDGSEVVTELGIIPHLLTVSEDQKHIAYSDLHNVFIYHVDNNANERVFTGCAYSISWSPDALSLFVGGTDNGIIRLSLEDGHYEKVADGYWVEALSGNRIGYFDKNRVAFFIKDLTKGYEKELLSARGSVIAMDWTASGRFLVVGYRVRTGMLTWGPQPSVYDTQTLEFHVLPAFPIHTNCLFLTEESGDRYADQFTRQ